MSRAIKNIATLGCLGYVSAPGTMGTVAALPLVYLVSLLPMLLQYCVIFCLAIFSFFIIKKALLSFIDTDPSQIILDEVVGCFITFAGIGLNLRIIFVGFVLFRFFDIVKPLGIKRLELLPGTWGVLIDDCAAGLVANILLRYFM